jgi:cellulose synthase/poly-beta-1,6-N-acetylglucosamine synthase-like glycosyltransferase
MSDAAAIKLDRPLLGSLLQADAFISVDDLNSAFPEQNAPSRKIVETLVSNTVFAHNQLNGASLVQFGCEELVFSPHSVDRTIVRFEAMPDYVTYGAMPWRKVGEVLTAVVVDDPDLSRVRSGLGLPHDTIFFQISRAELHRALALVFRTELVHASVHGLAESNPELSAHKVVTRPQMAVFAGLAAALLGTFAWQPFATAATFNFVLSGWVLITTLFKVLLVFFGVSKTESRGQAKEAPPVSAPAGQLPIYTILVPMYKEPELLPFITRHLLTMDYPKDRLDVKLVLEEDDELTLGSANTLDLPDCVEIVRVPACHPRTKPKACNYALHFARGEYLVIFDAEDRPETDQLRKVLAAFHNMSESYGCIQAQLNYSNSDENWLTKMFTLEYTTLFDALLPGLYRLGMPIPLGGTSNHFRIKALRAVGAWDPFNVTEDADLGMRLSQINYKVGVISSTTYEEANCKLGNWIRQRSRWIKGYMQTWLVHMRSPARLLAAAGVRGFIGFQLFIGGTIINSFAVLIFWIASVVWLMGIGDAFVEVFPFPVLVIGTVNLLFCNAVLLYINMFPAARRGYWSLVPWAITVPIYWFLMSVAACKAAKQLITNPFHWEKTTHGLSRLLQQDH